MLVYLSVICKCLYAPWPCHNIFCLLLYMSVKSSTELMLYVCKNSDFKYNFYTFILYKIHDRKCSSVVNFKVSITIMYKTNPELFFSPEFYTFSRNFLVFIIYISQSQHVCMAVIKGLT